ncbi:MAG: FAD-dependent oxidoreductase [Acidobacteriota bacterium]
MDGNPKEFDVVIIGGGPGGLSAAFWCAELGLKTAIFDQEKELGGQLLWTFNSITNYLGVEALSGRELRDKFLLRIANTYVTRMTGVTVERADLAKKSVQLHDGTQFSSKVIIISTGIRRRKLDVPGEEEFQGRGILASGVRSKDEVAGKTVLIVGGGDAAIENALILSEAAEKVVVVHRRNEFAARKEFVEGAKNRSNIEFVMNSEVTAIVGNAAIETVEIHSLMTGEHAMIAADALLIRIGVEPNSELFRAQIDRDDAGYISVNSRCETDLTGVYAIGDVANQASPTISTAVGNGATAAKVAEQSIRNETH